MSSAAGATSIRQFIPISVFLVVNNKRGTNSESFIALGNVKVMYLTNRVCWDIFKIFPDLTARVIQPVQFQLPPPPLARLTYDIYCIIASKPNLVTAATKFFFSKGHRETHPSGSPSNRQRV